MVVIQLARQGGLKTWRVNPTGFGAPDLKMGTFLLPITSLRRLHYPFIPLDANVREPDSTKATTNMLDTLKDPVKNKRFWAYNGGLIIIVKRASERVIRRETVVELDIPRADGYGLVNGGHTQWAINEAIQDGVNITDVLIRVELIIGDLTDNEIVDVGASRNMSKNVKDYSIQWKRGAWNELQAGVDPVRQGIVEWREGIRATTVVEVTQIIQWMMMMDQTFNTLHGGAPPIGQYGNSRIKAYRTYLARPQGYTYLTKILDDILNLKERIESQLATPPFHNAGGFRLANAKKSDMKLIFPSATRLTDETKLFHYPVVNKVHGGILLPILWSMSQLIVHDVPGRRVRWTHDWQAVWTEARPAILSLLYSDYVGPRAAARVSSALGIRRSTPFWNGCAQAVTAAARRVGVAPTAWKRY